MHSDYLFVCSQEVLEARILELEDSLQRLQKRVTQQQQQQQVSYLFFIRTHIAKRQTMGPIRLESRSRGAPQKRIHVQFNRI